MSQRKAKQLRKERAMEPETRAVKWWENPEIMSFLIALIIGGMILYVCMAKGEWVGAAADFVARSVEAYHEWVNK